MGDLGTAFRSTYTAVGDCINFASRLEAAARDLPTQLVIGSATNSQLTQHQSTSLGDITLRGTQTAIEVFTMRFWGQTPISLRCAAPPPEGEP